ncbi:MAG: hypothetical protein AAB383_04230 [Patescibacteria group bacterium]|mgnify:CR=1 FL=1
MKKGKEHFKAHRFPGQKPGENIQLVIRKHWIIDFKIAAYLLVIGLLPLVLSVPAGFLAWDGHFNDIFVLTSLGFTLYFLAILLIGYVKWLNEELDIIVATDTRIISHEQIDLFHRTVSEANLGQMQDVTGIQKGFLQSILHYGNIEIQTSASDVFFIIKHVSNPYENARALLDLRDRITPHHD